MKRISYKLRRKVVMATEDKSTDVNHYLLRADILRSDRDREQRLASGLCLACFYIPRHYAAGAMMTAWSCPFCHKPQPMWGSTAVPPICDSCSTHYHLCRSCLSDLDLSLTTDRNQPRRSRSKKNVPAAG